MKTKHNIKEILGNNVRKRRIHIGWSQEKLAEKVGLSKNEISSIELGKKFASANILTNLAIVLKTEVYELFKTDDVLPDKPADIIAQYGAEIREALARIDISFMEKMKSKPQI